MAGRRARDNIKKKAGQVLVKPPSLQHDRPYFLQALTPAEPTHLIMMGIAGIGALLAMQAVLHFLTLCRLMQLIELGISVTASAWYHWAK